MKKSMVIWSRNACGKRLLSLWALDSNGVPCYEIEIEWATTKLGCLFKLFKTCWWKKNLRYFFGICKVRKGDVNEKEKAILESYNYAKGSPFE